MSPVNNSNLFKTKTNQSDNFFHERGLGKLDLSFFIINWSNKYPIDKVWREKHGVAFNSKKHRKLKIIDLLIDIGQQVALGQLLQSPLVEGEYVGGRGKYFKKKTVQVITQKEIEQSFDKIDIENLEFDKEGNLIL